MKMSCKVLIIEDELIIAMEIQKIIQDLGYKVIGIGKSYSKSLEIVRKEFPDLILSDINLHKSRDGIETSTEICRIKKIPIIYITAYADEKIVQKAALSNPVSYILKPFKKEDIEVALKLSMCKKNHIDINDYVEKILQKNPNLKKIGFGYIYDIKHSNLYYLDIPVKLGYKEKKLLDMLVSANGNIVPFQSIETELWNDGVESENIIRVLLYRLRTKLEHKLIETIPSFGCRLIALH